MDNLSADIKQLPRHFLPEEFKVTTWDALQPYFEALQQRAINSVTDLENG